MKNLKIAVLLVTVILFGTQADIFAQQRKGMGNGQAMGSGQVGNAQGNGYVQGYFCNNIPGITEEQMSKMQNQRLIQMKERQANQNQMREKRAHLITLQSANNVNMNAVNKTIDEITALQNAQWKKRAAHKQAVRNILTDDQKVYYDNHSGRRGYGNRNGNCNNGRRGRGNGAGYGNGQGYGNSNWNN